MDTGSAQCTTPARSVRAGARCAIARAGFMEPALRGVRNAARRRVSCAPARGVWLHVLWRVSEQTRPTG